MAASPAWPRPAGFPSPRGRRGTTLRPERPSPARSGLHTVARSWTASGISGIAELSQLVAVLVPFQPGAGIACRESLEAAWLAAAGGQQSTGERLPQRNARDVGAAPRRNRQGAPQP